MSRSLERAVFLFAWFWLGAISTRADETVMEILPVKNRPAQEIASILAPLVGPQGAVSAATGRVIVRATPAALARIKRIVRELDVAPRSLWISVRQSRVNTSDERSGGIGVTIESRGRTRATGVFAERSERTSDDAEQRLRALEGERAFIALGRAIPLTQTVVSPYGVERATIMRETGAGFFAIPRLSDNGVTLEISAAQGSVDNRGRVNEQRVTTIVSGKLGEWIEVAGASIERTDQSGSIGFDERSRAAEERGVFLKVELVE